MTVRGGAVHKDHNHIQYITELSPINNCFHNGCLSWPSWQLLKGLKLKLVHA